MTFDSGHKYYPPKDGRPAGLTKARARALRTLAIEIREAIDPSYLRQLHTLVAAGLPAKFLLDGDQEVCGVTWDGADDDPSGRGAIPPTLEQRMNAVKWLADRGWGQPAQTIHLEADLRAQVSALGASVDFGQVSAGVLRTFLDGIRAGALPVGDAGSALPASSELELEPVSADSGDDAQ